MNTTNSKYSLNPWILIAHLFTQTGILVAIARSITLLFVYKAKKNVNENK